MRSVLLLAVLLGLAACGDPATNDTRGYTKAPLEDPGLVIGSEPDAGLGTARIPLEPGMTGAEPSSLENPAEPSGGGQPAGGEVTLASGVTQDQYDEGKALFSGQGGCQACHGPGGTGAALAPNLTDDTWLHVDGPDVSAIAGVIRNGVPNPMEHPGPMPPMGGANLTDEQIQALAGYVASLSAG